MGELDKQEGHIGQGGRPTLSLKQPSTLFVDVSNFTESEGALPRESVSFQGNGKCECGRVCMTHTQR
jgi:hypothetical protein